LASKTPETANSATVHDGIQSNGKTPSETQTAAQIGEKPVSFMQLKKRGKKEKDEGQPYTNRKSISEVLHDIYDKNTH